MIYDCAIIGAGPAGIISSIQLKRSGFNIVLLEKKKIGGALFNADKIENYLGFADGISGGTLVSILRRQLKKFNINPRVTTVTKISREHYFKIYTKKNEYAARSVIVATGTIPKKAGLSGEETLVGKRVFYEIKDFPSMKQSKEIAIIGGGDVGFDYALNLAERKHKPYIITQHKIKCLSLLKKRAEMKKILSFEDMTPISIKRNTHKIEIICKERRFMADYVLIAVGRKPISPTIEMTNTRGLFIAGDVQNANRRQVHIATGDGMQAAMNVMEYLQTK